MQKLQAIIRINRIRENAKTFLKRTDAPLYAVVKADGYGHGGVEVAAALQGLAEGYCVSLLEEGLTVKGAACGKEILVLTPPTQEREAWLAFKNGLTLTVGNVSSAKLVDAVTKKSETPACVHLKCNTGMNRYGLTEKSLYQTCELFRRNPWIRVTGIYSHLYLHTPSSAEEQRIRFVDSASICRRFYPKARRHLSATYGSLLGKAFAFDGVRVGIGLYGYLPDDVEEELPLQKAMQVYAKCVDERRYAFGGVGYSSLTVKKGTPLYTLRCGYADGISYFGQGRDGLKSRLATPCMDACVCAGRREKGAWVPVLTDARKTAREQKTICYEILCRATARAERVYVYD